MVDKARGGCDAGETLVGKNVSLSIFRLSWCLWLHLFDPLIGPKHSVRLVQRRLVVPVHKPRELLHRRRRHWLHLQSRYLSCNCAISNKICLNA